MATTAVGIANGNVPAPDYNGHRVDDSIDFVQKYAQEREKRSGRGMEQYIDIKKSAAYSALLDDPWIEAGTAINQLVQEGDHAKIIVVGAGYGGILFAVELLKAGFHPDDLLIVDPAGGFGGTWYYNRYPNLMCDVESYIYMPLLEEMDYMPKHKYSYGPELRAYGDRMADKYGLRQRAMFQTKADTVAWNDQQQRWDVQLKLQPKGGQSADINITAEFVILATGLFNTAKLPDVKGGETFQGDQFHTARWNYKASGGSPENQELTKLQGKRVGIIGTGATSIQVVPALAKWAKEVFVFQRTPSAVAERNNHATDESDWRKSIASKPGWQRERNLNYFAHLCNVEQKPAADLVNDGWTKLVSYSALIGSPSYNVAADNIEQHKARMQALDYPLQEAVRQRAAKVVQDPETAKKLQAWYPSWCKRPCFHDEYLQAFNLPHVSLIEANGQGVEQITSTGVRFGGKTYDIDVLVWGTGYVSPSVGTPASKAGIHLTGRDGRTLDQLYEEDGTGTLHGVTSRNFPNVFWAGASQGGASPNWTFILDNQAKHVAYILAESRRKQGDRIVIEPSREAEEGWSMQCAAGAATFASISGCTPGYLNKEGETDTAMPVEKQIKAARGAPWSKGIADYATIIQEWRAEGSMKGLEVTAVA